MIRLDLEQGIGPADGAFGASVLLDVGGLKLRRIRLAGGARIPPCQMQEDVVFVVLAGRVTFRTDEDGGQEELVDAPGAVFVPGGATTRSMEAHTPSTVLALLCRANGPPPHRGAGVP